MKIAHVLLHQKLGVCGNRMLMLRAKKLSALTYAVLLLCAAEASSEEVLPVQVASAVPSHEVLLPQEPLRLSQLDLDDVETEDGTSVSDVNAASTTETASSTEAPTKQTTPDVVNTDEADGDVIGVDETSLTDESLESLMNTTVTSVSRKAELFSDVPAALTVITQEDIRRSGLTNLPEVLRLVPGLYVGRISAHKWAISARGFSQEFANLLLVLIDGRTVYNPTFSGVYWDAQDIMLEDVERIEVIRGPGAAVWGANAVNGVINIITKAAKDTQGGLLTTRIGSQEKIGAARYGTKMGKNAFGRFYIKRSEYDETRRTDGSGGDDAWDVNRAGFRIDWEKNPRDTVTLQGDINRSRGDDVFSSVTLAPPTNTLSVGRVTDNSLNVLGRWTRILGKDSDMSLQMYYDRSDHRRPAIDNKSEQFDIDFNHRFRPSEKHEVVWGLGYRKTRVAFRNSFEISINPSRDKATLYSAFVQDDISLSEDKLRLVLGTKVEHNSFTGLEIQPTGRLVWTPDSQQTLWAAVSHAVRTPNFFDLGIRVNPAAFPNPNPAAPPVLASIFGTSSPASEKLTAHEIGYRVQTNERLVIDVAAFYNRYSRLLSIASRTPFVELDPPRSVLPIFYGYGGRGATQGFEISSTWKVYDRWKLTGNYTRFKAGLKLPAGGFRDVGGEFPQHMVQIRSSHDLPRNLTFDVFASLATRHELSSQSIPAHVIPAHVIPAHTRVDLRFGWRPSPDLDLSIGIQNLTSRRHAESQATVDISREVPRSLYVQGTWKF